MTKSHSYVDDLLAISTAFGGKHIDEEPYGVFADFGIFLRDRILQFGVTDYVVSSAFDYLNRVLNGRADDELHNMIDTGILEVLGDSQQTAADWVAALTRSSEEGI